VAYEAPPGRNADDIRPQFITHPETAGYYEPGDTPDPDHVGMFRDPLVLSDGTLWAAHSTAKTTDGNDLNNSDTSKPFALSSRYNFAITKLVDGPNGYKVPGPKLIPGGIVKSITYFDNSMYRQVTYNGKMWELQPVEIRTHAAPPVTSEELPAIEQNVLEEELGGAAGVQALKTYLRENNLALVVSRDVTVRADKQQDFNLKVKWSDHQTAEAGSTPKELAYMQFFEGKQLRGFREGNNGRRVLARHMDSFENPTDEAAPESSVRLGDDGSMAAFVPAARALVVADDGRGRHPRRARALLADLQGRRDPRLHQLPRPQPQRRLQQSPADERARGPAHAGALVARPAARQVDTRAQRRSARIGATPIRARSFLGA
jgi:hypothetical protein